MTWVINRCRPELTETEYQINSKTSSKTGKEGPGCRYAVYDFEWELKSGEGIRNKIA